MRKSKFSPFFLVNTFPGLYIEELHAFWTRRLIRESRMARFSTAESGFDWEDYYSIDTVSRTTRFSLIIK